MLHVLNRRYLAVFFDPVLACNLRCVSCYFSNDAERAKLNGVFKEADLVPISKAVFGRTLRLQIGCGAEPTLFKHNPALIRLAKEAGVPYVSFTTNANLLTEQMIADCLAAGLDEMTISVHGVRRETYEALMVNAVYDKFHESLRLLSEYKKQYPAFKVRLNYTINHKNVAELMQFFEVYGGCDFDILQLRALRNIGGVLNKVELTADFWKHLNHALPFLESECQKRAILYMEPNNFENDDERNMELEVTNNAYAYISPKVCIEPDFDWRHETFNQYANRTNYASRLFSRIFK